VNPGTLLFVLLAATPHADDPPPTTSSRELKWKDPSAEDLIEGAKLYERHCLSCHGPKGEGGRGPTLAQPKLPRATDNVTLMKIIREGVRGTEMPEARFERDDIRKVAAWVLKLGELPPEVVPGDPARGRTVYFGKGACALCHSLEGRGGAFGPDLSDIGLRRGTSHLRRALVEPGADVPRAFSRNGTGVTITQNFLLVRVATKGGRRVTGIRMNEDAFSIQIRDASQQIHSFWKADLAELHKDWGQSPMPGYDRVLSKDELDDMVAFLVSLKSETQ
jgi:cytochrome c oxidase cbb3-type subunit III